MVACEVCRVTIEACRDVADSKEIVTEAEDQGRLAAATVSYEDDLFLSGKHGSGIGLSGNSLLFACCLA